MINEKISDNLNIIYVDCFAGCAGDMLLGALFDMGLPFEEWKREVLKLGITGVEMYLEEKMESSIRGKKFHVDIKIKQEKHRTFKDISKMIKTSGIADVVKNDAIAVFSKIADAEATVHNTKPAEVHFHEVGALDSIIDIVGFCVAKEMMKIDSIISSPFHLGTGTVRTQHGIMPVPAPATLEIIRGKPAISKGVEGELTTPTGAGILSTLADEFGMMPALTIQAVGYGYGNNKLSIPNFVRVLYGTRGNL